MNRDRIIRADNGRNQLIRISEASMDIIESIVRAGLMVGFLVLVILAVAALFMIVFGIATGIDEKIQS
jgi:cell division protein FtsX